MATTNILPAAAAAALLAAAPVLADEVRLHNGDRLTGKVIRLTADKLTLETKYAGKVEIQRGEIAAIDAETEVQAMMKGEAEVRPVRGPVPLAAVAFLNPSPEQSGIGVAYKGRFTLSSAHVRGNSSSSTTVAEAVVEARAKRYRWELQGSAAQASESGKETASSWLAQGTYDRFVAAKRFFYGRTSVERDRFAGVDLRATLGGGYGVQFRETDRTRLSLRGGLEYVSLDPVTGPDDRYPAFGWGLRYAHKVFDRRAEVFHEQDGYWNLERTRDVTLRSRTGLRIPLIEGLTASAQLNVDWENEPEPGRDATDSTLLLGLGYAW